MSYKKFVKKVSLPTAKLATSSNDVAKYEGLYSKYKNYLPMVYQGPTNRIERYSIYDGMEQDPIINTSLDVLAEYITQSINEDPFHIEYGVQAQLPESHTTSIEKTLDTWIKINDLRKRVFNMVREVLKYGDVIYIRDPETNVLNKVNIYDVVGVVVNETKEPTHYIIKNVDLNIPLKVASSAKNDVNTKNLINTMNGSIPGTTNTLTPQGVNNTVNDPTSEVSTLPITAENILHLSMNIDNILIYPFGLSVLESIYKTYVQK